MNTTTAAEKTGVSVQTIRRWCRAGRIQATKTNRVWIIEPASLPTREDIMDYELVEGRAYNGDTLHIVRHTATGQEIDSSRNRAAMVARLEQLNAGRPMATWAAEHDPRRLDTRPGPTCPSCGLRHYEGQC